MKFKLRLSLANIFSLVALLCGVFATHHAFWPSGRAYQFLIAADYIAIMSVASTAALFTAGRQRAALLGFAIFGWAYPVFVFPGSLSARANIFEEIELGLAMAALTGFATWLWVSIVAGNSSDAP
jgi:hypothetical protein